MKWLRALSIGALAWLVIFVEVSITMISLKLSNVTVYFIHYLLLIPISIFLAWFYYQSKDKTNGFLLGIALLISGIVLDLVITVPLFIIPQGGGFYDYFTSSWTTIGFVEMIVIVGLYDLFRRKK